MQARSIGKTLWDVWNVPKYLLNRQQEFDEVYDLVARHQAEEAAREEAEKAARKRGTRGN